MKLSIVFCCNEQGICRGVVDCIRIYGRGDCLLDLVCDGRPPVYRNLGRTAGMPVEGDYTAPYSLKIGRCRLLVDRLRLFGGSWNADEAEITPRNATRLVNWLSASKKWRCEAGVQKLFDKFRRGGTIFVNEIEEAART